MRKLIFSAFTCLILFTVAMVNAQHRPTQARSDVSPVKAPEKRDKLINDCSTPDRPKPSVELQMKGNLLCGKAISLPKPAYPEEAKAKGISGVVAVNVVTDENGDVIWAKAVEGHPLLQQAAISAACRAKYSPEKISKRPIKVSRMITYNFEL